MSEKNNVYVLGNTFAEVEAKKEYKSNNGPSEIGEVYDLASFKRIETDLDIEHKKEEDAAWDFFAYSANMIHLPLTEVVSFDTWKERQKNKERA